MNNKGPRIVNCRQKSVEDGLSGLTGASRLFVKLQGFRWVLWGSRSRPLGRWSRGETPGTGVEPPPAHLRCVRHTRTLCRSKEKKTLQCSTTNSGMFDFPRRKDHRALLLSRGHREFQTCELPNGKKNWEKRSENTLMNPKERKGEKHKPWRKEKTHTMWTFNMTEDAINKLTTLRPKLGGRCEQVIS